MLISHQEKAGLKLVRRLFTAFWESIIDVLSSGFKTQDFNEISKCLNGLQITSRLCIKMKLQSKCGNLFALFAMSSNPFSSRFSSGKNRSSLLQMKKLIESIRNFTTSNRNLTFCTTHLLSMHFLLNNSIEIGSHCSSCWKYVFQCCLTITEIENYHFFGRTKRSLLSSILAKSGIKQQNDDLILPNSNEIDEMPGIRIHGDPNELIEKLIQDCVNGSITCDGVIRGKHLDMAIELLSQFVDKFFDEAARKLNLKTLSSFLSELCLSSREQIGAFKNMMKNGKNFNLSIECFFLNKLNEVLLRCARSGRPLIHMMKCWSIVSPYLVEAVAISNCFGTNNALQCIANKSVSTLHDVISLSLTLHSELIHFHFNEALFKPFETIMLLELCDIDTQELIISSICEFVEGSAEEIRSGWRSLFGAICALRFPNDIDDDERIRQLKVILNIFQAFLHTDNLDVFANAALDCLSCLLRLIKDDNSNEIHQKGNLCLVGLKYLHQFSSLLSLMYQMPGCPCFPITKLIQASSQNPRIIETPTFCQNEKLEAKLTLDQLDRTTKILHVWFMLVDGIALSIELCPKERKNDVINLFFYTLKSFVEIPGELFFTNFI